MLPDGSGLDVLRELRERGDATPVLLLTARDAVKDRIGGLDAGADDYLGKPFDLDEVAARLRAISRRSSGRARSEEHTSELQSLMRISFAVFCLKTKKIHQHSTLN